MNELPKIISVDDHVVEPPHVWQTWLPEKYRAKGPRVERKRWGAVRAQARAPATTNDEDPDGEWGDAWIYEDRLIYVHKKFVAIPLEATPGGDVVEVRPHDDGDDRRHLRRHAPGLLRPRRPRRGLRAQLDRRVAAVPDVPALLRPDVLRGRGQGPRRSRACRPTTTGWSRSGASRREGVNIPLCLIPLWDVELAARGDRSATPTAACRAICFSELPPRLEPAEHPHRPLGPGVRGVQRHRRHPVHAHRLVVDDAGGVARRARGRRRHARVQQLDGVARRLAVLGQAHRVPEAEARVLRGPDRLDPVRARAGRHACGTSTTPGSTRRS